MHTGVLSGYPSGQQVEGFVLITESGIKQTSSNKDYVRWSGLDYNAQMVSGTLFGADNTPPPQINAGMVYHTRGAIGQNRAGGLDVWSSAMVPVTDVPTIEEFKNSCYPTVHTNLLTHIIQQLTTYSECFQVPELKRLSQAMFAKMLPHLRTLPAGKSVHDDVRGGLAQHTYNVLSIVDTQLLKDHQLNMEALLFSALYHDIGKIHSYTGEMQMTEEGMFLPHLVDSVKILTECIILNDIKLDKKLRWQIEHCLSSHHGKEFSPAKPCTREANALYFADHMVSNIAHIEGKMRKREVGSDGWTTYSNILGTRAYIHSADTDGA